MSPKWGSEVIFIKILLYISWDCWQGYSIEHHQRYQLFFQLTRMTRDKGALAKDDRLDALAMAVAYWSKALAVETEKVVQRKREEMMQAELERYMAHAIGYRPKGRLYATTGHER